MKTTLHPIAAAGFLCWLIFLACIDTLFLGKTAEEQENDE